MPCCWAGLAESPLKSLQSAEQISRRPRAERSSGPLDQAARSGTTSVEEVTPAGGHHRQAELVADLD